jgi:hypothetical protein
MLQSKFSLEDPSPAPKSQVILHTPSSVHPAVFHKEVHLIRGTSPYLCENINRQYKISYLKRKK